MRLSIAPASRGVGDFWLPGAVAQAVPVKEEGHRVLDFASVLPEGSAREVSCALLPSRLVVARRIYSPIHVPFQEFYLASP